MPRTLESVSRQSRLLGFPFGGLRGERNPRQIGPVNALEALNVILSEGAISKRHGFRGWSDQWSPIEPSADLGGRCEGLHSFVARDYGSSLETLRSFGALKRVNGPNLSGLSASARLYLWQTAAAGWTRAVDSGGAQWSTYDKGQVDDRSDDAILDPMRFYDVESSARNQGAASADKGYDRLVYMLDGHDYGFKSPIQGHRLWYIGLSPPTSVTYAVSNVDGNGPTFQSDTTWDVKIALANRRGVPFAEVDLGLLSNAEVVASAIGMGGWNTLTIAFNVAVSVDKMPWTHAYVYRRVVQPVPTQTHWRRIAGFYRANYDNGDSTQTAQLGGALLGRTYSLVITNLSGVIQEASATGAWSYAPTRNNRPQNKHYFAVYERRGWWASKYDANVQMSDIVGENTGGHYEAIGGEALDIPEGPCTLLAPYLNHLVIGTPKALFIHQGIYGSHTNTSIARDLDVPPGSANTERVAVERGPIAYGTGSFVVADNRLYYISELGLEMYDGREVVNVSRGILPSLRTFANITGSLTRVLRDAQLAHDPVKRIIYLLARQLITYNDEVTGQATQHIYAKGRIYCYHYPDSDPSTGELQPGRWSIWDQIGPGALQQGQGLTQVHLDRRDRYSAICMRHYPDKEAQLAMATQDVTEEGGAPGQYLTYRLVVVMEQFPDAYKDTFLGMPGGPQFDTGITWSWKSGNYDLGLIERRKLFHYLSVQTASADAASADMTIGYSVDGAAYVTAAVNSALQNAKMPVQTYGSDISIAFQGSDSQRDAVVLGAALDVEPVGYF